NKESPNLQPNTNQEELHQPESPNPQPKPNESPESPKLPTNPTPTKKKTNRKTPTKPDDALQDLQKWALSYYAQYNKLPSRRLIIEQFGLSDWKARQFL